MLKRLIIAVFGICLLVGLGSTAFAGPDVREGLSEVQKIVPNHPRHSQLNDARPTQPAFKKPTSARQPLPPGTPAPGSPSLIYFCDAQSYAGGPAYFWTIPDAYGDDLFNTRFTVEAGFECTLKVAHFLMYGPAMTGTPDMRTYLWADDGFGFPGALLDSVDVPYATLLAAGFGYVSADYSSAGWVFADGDEYHYGYTPIGVPGDTLAIVSDNGSGPFSGEERSSEYYAGTWGSMLNDWGLDVVFEIVSERCCNEIPFSDCYVQSYWGGISYFWATPHQSYGDEEWAMRFDVGGPETLASVDFYVYNYAAGPDPAGNNDIYVNIYNDDGSGLPGTLITSTTLPATTYPFFPAVTSVPFAPLVLSNTFHVAIGTNGVSDFVVGFGAGDTYEAILSDNGTFGTGRSSSDWGGGTWVSMLAGWGLDVNFLIDVYMCRDEFSDCSTQPGCLNGLAYFWRLPDIYGDYINAQKIPSPGEECRINEVTWAMYWHPAEAALPLYTHPSLLNVYSDAGGLPGALLYQTTISVADYGAPVAGGGLFLLTKDVQALEWDVTGDYWIGIESTAPIPDEGIRTLSDAGGGGCNLQAAEYYGVWGHMSTDWGLPPDVAFYVDVDQCCIPFSGRACAPPDDNWSSRSHDQARTGASQLAIGDAWCDLNLNIMWEDGDAAKTAQTMGPVIHDGRAYQVLETATVGSVIRVFDLYTGALEQTISNPALGNFIENDPLIVGSKLYIAGGDNRIVSRWDISVSGAASLDWTRTLGAVGGPLRRTNLLLVDVGGTGVLSGGTQLGRAFAINESDGLDYPGWATNPITLDAGQLVQGSATDGGQLYFGTRQAGLNGDLWAIDPATGAVNWKLSTAGGYQGLTVYASITSEAFPQLSIDGGVLHVGARPTGNFPTDGLYYRVDAGTGAVLSVAASVGNLFSNPIIDVNLVYLPTVSGWVTPAFNGNLMAFSKNTGSLVWVGQNPYEGGADTRVFNNGLLTCEPEPDADIIIYGNIRGTLSFVNSITGEQLFRRRADYGGGANSMIGGTAIGTDSSGAVHVLAGSFIGTLYDLTKGADRPRLEIQDYDPVTAVEFSVSTSEIYTVPSIITNTGCADLTFNAVNVDDVSFGSTDPFISPLKPVRPGLYDAASLLADQMAANAMKFKNPESWIEVEVSVENNLLAASEQSLRNEQLGSRAALAYPVYLNSVVEPFAGQVVPAGDSIDLVLDVNPSLINRGPQVFYIELDTDDPDFFLNAGSAGLPNDHPQLVITLVGGCLTDTTTLEFGIGGANIQLVTNTGRLGTGDWTPHGFEIDGEDAAFYQGGYIFGVSRERIAFNSQDWSGGGGEANAWISIQGDPNYCDNSCKPALLTGVSLGAISSDGVTYSPITGNLISKSWIDSVQDFSFGGSVAWDWKNWGAPFHADSSMGLSANTRTIGALDVAELANLTVEIFEITERNGGSVDSFKFGVNIDYDLAPILGGGADTSILNVAASAAWTTSAQSPAADYAWGFIKLPFGCGENPIKNAKGLDAGQGHFIAAGGAARGDGYMDSAYIYMRNPQGANPSHQVTGAPDQQIHGTLVEHNFGPNETLTFAVAQFGFNSGITSPRTPNSPEIIALANLANKWVGFGRGDVNNDNAVNLSDIMALAGNVNSSGPGAYPFEHLGDVDADGDVDNADLNYLINYYFQCGPCPVGDWVILDCTP